MTSRVEGSYNYLETGLSVDVMQNSLPTSGYNMQYGVQEIWKSEDGLKALYWQPASNFNSYNHNDFYYQAAVGVTGYAGYAVWTYSDVAYRSWGDEPVIENVYYYGENPLAVNMTLTTWDYEAQVGVCYSTSNDLPTLEQCDGVAQCPDTSVGYGVSSYYEFTLPAGTYYVEIDSSSNKNNLLESGGKSSWGNAEVKGYVKVVVSASGAANTTVKYYVALADTSHHGIKDSTTEADRLTRGSVETSGVSASIPGSAAICIES